MGGNRALIPQAARHALLQLRDLFVNQVCVREHVRRRPRHWIGGAHL